ncbi:MAG: hypothetical protein M1823_004987 [Watsoniomyces obsoletus]|nr:MAG: hypothetical protein M1823_004987 [Watsoniomyces obsoletus]
MSSRISAARPKRAGEAFARTQHLHGDGPATKKARFDVRNPSALAPDEREEDAILELDEIGKSGAQTKRNAVNIDGYGSDSSNEGFDARAEARAKATKKAVPKDNADGDGEAENDMFADLEEEQFPDGDEDEDLNREGKQKKKEVRFLDEDEIEGQVQGSKSGGHVSADFTLNDSKGKGKARAHESSGGSSSGDDSEEEENQVSVGAQDVDEEIGAGGKKSNAPRLSAFNMREELEEGRFDTQGNFVRKAGDPDAVHDTWLEGISKKEQKRAREAEEKRLEDQRQRTLADDQLLTGDVLGTLITRLEKGETVLEALARIGKGLEKKKKKPQPKWMAKKKTKGRQKEEDDDAMDLDRTNGHDNDPVAESKRKDVDAITGAADLLLTRGNADIYGDTREALMRQYRRETGDDWVDSDPVVNASSENSTLLGKKANGRWEYRWVDARDGGDVHGPYEGKMMKQWQDAGFFQEGVEFRRHIDTGSSAREREEWIRVVDFG